MEENRKLLSIIVPCYNEGKVLKKFHSVMMEQMKCLNCKYDYEIIYVNDGSSDNTQTQIADISLNDDAVKYICFSRNFGKESAMLAGMEYSSGECIVIIDADLQHPPELIHQMLEKYEEGFDQVIAKRNRKGDSLKNRFFARTYYKLVKNMVDVKMIDGAGDFRLLSRAAADAVLSLKETNRFSKGIFSWVGFNQTYIEYENRKRTSDASRWSFNRLVKYGVDGIVSFNTQPLRLCVYLGGALLVLSMAYLIYLFISIILHGIDVPGYFTTIAMISIIGGVQLISLGIIGEYVGRIYAEVKKRPAYIIASTNIQEGTVNEK